MGKIEKPKKEKIHFYYNKEINLNIQIQNSIEKLNAIFKQKKSWVKIVHSLRDVSIIQNLLQYGIITLVPEATSSHKERMEKTTERKLKCRKLKCEQRTTS